MKAHFVAFVRPVCLVCALFCSGLLGAYWTRTRIEQTVTRLVRPGCLGPRDGGVQVEDLPDLGVCP
jgi:hypothetical protein